MYKKFILIKTKWKYRMGFKKANVRISFYTNIFKSKYKCRYFFREFKIKNAHNYSSGKVNIRLHYEGWQMTKFNVCKKPKYKFYYRCFINNVIVIYITMFRKTSFVSCRFK